jgi:hypothetical protein
MCGRFQGIMVPIDGTNDMMDGWMSSNNDNPFCFCICWWQGRKLAIKVKCKLKRNDGRNGMNGILVIQNIWQMPMGKPCKDNNYLKF